MLTTIPPSVAPSTTAAMRRTESVRRLLATLDEGFGVPFGIFDGTTGEVLDCHEGYLAGNEAVRSALAPVVAGRREPEVIGQENHALVLAIPFGSPTDSLVAVAALATSTAHANSDVQKTASLLGLPSDHTASWLREQPLWTSHVASRMARMCVDRWEQDREAQELKREIQTISDHLGTTYEEISLLYSVTQNLKISSSDEQLARLALDWLQECLPAESLAVWLLPVSEGLDTYKTPTDAELLTAHEFPLDATELGRLIGSLPLGKMDRPFVANRSVTGTPDWDFPSIDELIIVPLAEGTNVFGYMAAVNHRQVGEEFGTVEATLMSSVATILGIHAGNRDLYRQQAEFLASVVRALTSAIDAKDPYTCGHSDRVARVSVRLAQQLGHSAKDLNTIYMSGLLHDIGKIGVDDRVLRKPGRLTDEEFEQIKLHPELGFKILADIKQLADVIPAVLHHHEQWNGSGYPHGLKGEQIPMLARIVAVADAYDAMTSHRPYRAGMPEERVHQIFEGGAGGQWDARVIRAYFEAQHDIREIVQRERANLSLDVQQWTE